MAALHLPDDWKERIEELVASDTGTAGLEKRRQELHNQLRRLNYQYEHGLIVEADFPAYEKKAQQLIREINSIVIPSPIRTGARWERDAELQRGMGKGG